MSCFIIAEAGVNHNGSLDMALQLIDEAKKAGASAVKFQTFNAEDLVSPSTEKAEYQKDTTGEGSQLEMLKSLELPVDYYPILIEHCKKVNIEFMSTGFNPEPVDFLIHLGIERIKLPSGELNNTVLLKHVARKNLPIIMSTGMATLEEVKEAIKIINETRQELHFTEPLKDILTILHCTSNYPTEFSDVNLKAMQSMQEAFNLPVGYSDHTPGILISPVAVAMGAVVIEKHFTLDKDLPGPDHRASIDPQELRQLVMNIRDIEKSLGNGVKAPRPNELAVRDVVRRSVTLKQSVVRGHRLTENDLQLLRPGTGIPPAEMPLVVGQILKKDLSAGTTLQWSDLECIKTNVY